MRAWIENQYGEHLAELEVVDKEEFHISQEEWASLLPVFLLEGDIWRVKVEK